MQKKEEKEESSAYDHVVKYVGVFGGIQGVNLFASIFRNKLVSEILGPAGLGLISLYNTAITFLSNATNFGISFSAIRHVSELYEQGNENELIRFVRVVRSWSLGTGLLGMFFCCLLAPLLNYFYFETWIHWGDFVLLSPMLVLLALTGGELAILKGTRRLKQVALQSLINSLSTLVIAIPIYYIWRESGIIYSLLLLSMTAFLSVVWFSFRAYPFSFPSFSLESFRQGYGMVRLGMAVLIVGILNSGVDFLIRAYMVQVSSEVEVGLYNAGYTLVVTYVSMVFMSMDTDFFPRLSAVNHLVDESNRMVNNQISVSVMLVSPLLVIFLVFLPILLPLFYASSFLPVIGMAQCAVFGMYLRAVALPISYLLLAKGRSRIYLLAETSYNVLLVLLVIVGYSWKGLSGAGIALSLASFADLLLAVFISKYYYQFRLFGRTLRILAYQLPFGMAAFVVTHVADGWKYWILGSLCILGSLFLSVRFLYRETTIIHRIARKLGVNTLKY